MPDQTPFAELVEVMARLRAADGCPWDQEQTHASLKPYLLEEAYEALEAIDQEDDEELCKELGDVLLQVVFHAQLAKEAGLWDVFDVAAGNVAKLKARHPHIYGTTKVRGADDVLANWEKIKRQHKRGGGLLSSIPVAMPALQQAQLVQERCRRVGFDWDRPEHVLDKVEEEIGELRHELAQGRRSRARVKEELGDLLFALVNLARHLDVDAEGTLKDANAKFRARFRYIEQHFASQGRELGQVSLDEMEAVWQQAKNAKSEVKRTKGKAGPGRGRGQKRKRVRP